MEPAQGNGSNYRVNPVSYQVNGNQHPTSRPIKVVLIVVLCLISLFGGSLIYNYLHEHKLDPSPVQPIKDGFSTLNTILGGSGSDSGDSEDAGTDEAFAGSPRTPSILTCKSLINSPKCVVSTVTDCATQQAQSLSHCLEDEDVCVTNPLQTACLPAECPASLAELEDMPFGACGSVEQIYIVNAPAGVKISAIGPETYTGTTDNLGGLVLRDVQPGDYVVTIGDADDAEPGAHDSYGVIVMNATDKPSQSFYDSQDLSTTEGYIKTRDGTFLDYHLQMPAGGCSAAAKCDVIITYSGYFSGLGPTENFDKIVYDKLIPEGYAVMGVNMRGTACSGGSFKLMEDIVGLDGYDMVEAVGAQDWVDNVALGDKSWPGISQLYVASTQPPSLDAILPGAFITDFYRDVFYPGGIPNSGFPIKAWGDARDANNAVPSNYAPINDQVLADPVCAFNQRLHRQSKSISSNAIANPLFNDYWEGQKAHPEKITVPVMMTVAWQDEQVRSRGVSILEELPDSTPYRFVGSNGGHNQYWSTDIWPEVLEFANTYLRGDAQTIAAYEAEDPIKIFMEVNSNGVARTSFTLPEFPVSGTGNRFDFSSDLVPDDADSVANESSTFSYAPDRAAISWTSTAQDKVKFTSAALGTSKIYDGFASTDLWVRTSATDMDLRAIISEVRPDGKEMFVQEGWLRASHRALDEDKSTDLRPIHPNTASEPLTPNQPTLMRIEMLPFVHAFRAGSKIRIIIAPAPGPDITPPTALSLGWIYNSIPGTFDVTVLHDSTHMSSLVMHELTSPSASTILSGISSLPACTTSTTTAWNQPCRTTQ